MDGLSKSPIVREDKAGMLSRLTFQWVFPLLSVSVEAAHFFFFDRPHSNYSTY